MRNRTCRPATGTPQSFFVFEYDRVRDMHTQNPKALFIFAWVALSGALVLGFWFFNSKDSGEYEVQGTPSGVVEEKNRQVVYVVEDGDTWEKIMRKWYGWSMIPLRFPMSSF